MSESHDDLQTALKDAAALVADLPEELRSVAFQEAFRALRGNPVATAANPSPSPIGTAAAPTDLPDADLIARRGERLHKIAYAVHRIGTDGGDCTTGAIKTYLSQQLATKIKPNGVPDVLKANTPRYFQRQRVGREFSYELTDKGLAMLVEFGRSQSAE